MPCPCPATLLAHCREINRGGLLLIYQILVDTSQADIAKALQVRAGTAMLQCTKCFQRAAVMLQLGLGSSTGEGV